MTLNTLTDPRTNFEISRPASGSLAVCTDLFAQITICQSSAW